MSQILPITASETAPKRLTILGATGSIGQSTLSLLSHHSERFSLVALTAQDNVELLIEQARAHLPERVVIGNEAHYTQLKEALSALPIEVAAGEDALVEAAAMPADMVMAAIVGAAGLTPTLNAIEHGNDVALANKECLVCAGELVMQQAKHHQVRLLPVDSEHNAIFQCFDSQRPDDVEKLVITASGGPFREYSLDQMRSVTPAQAVKHPNWDMGAKISVDSATMMNKGLEMIEAYHLFPMKASQIEAVVHPESIIHSLVYTRDGSVLAQLSEPDMRIPIAYALSWPQRMSTPCTRLDLAAIGNLSFYAPDTERFPALSLARNAMESGGSAPIVLNAANEIAVQAFLEERIGFLDIAACVAHTLDATNHGPAPDIPTVIAIDREARLLAQSIVKK